MGGRRNAPCLLLVLCSASFIITFATPVDDNGAQTRADRAPLHFSLSKITDRTNNQLRSASFGPRSVLKKFSKKIIIRELQTIVDKHLPHPRGNDLQDPITYFQGKGRQQRSVLLDRRWPIVDFRVKRNVGSEDGRVERRMPGGKQKKAKVLGRLLMNGASNKLPMDVNEQDDYADEEDEDYSRGLNDDKVNWRDYENEDGPSVMELIALSVRHKNKKWSSDEERFGY